MTTQIIQEHAGYYWEWDIEATQWQMHWQPISRWYSPPCLHPNIHKYDLQTPFWIQDKIGLLIGRQGANFIKITEQTGCIYIFYRSITGNIEIWGQYFNIISAIHMIKHLMWKIKQHYKHKK